jgi:multidrug resistance protein
LHDSTAGHTQSNSKTMVEEPDHINSERSSIENGPDEKIKAVEKSIPKDEPDSNSIARVVSGPPYSAFSSKTKLFIVLTVAIAALISPFAATLFYPALNVLADQLNVSDSLITLSVTTYMLAQAISPAFIAGLSDQGGRRLSFIICFSIYIVANIGLALQTNYAALLVLRCVQAFGSSPTIALAIAVVADVATSAERGRYMGYATGGILIGPAFGPVLGGVLAEYLGWRSIFWFLVIFGSVLFILFVVLFPETCRNVVGNGSIPARGVNRSMLGYWQQRRNATDVESQRTSVKQENKLVFPNPLLTLNILKEKESAMLLVYNGLFFNGQMALSTALPYLLQRYYGFNTLQVGLCFLPLGCGSLLAALTTGRVVDWNFRRHANKIGMVLTKGKQQDLTNYPIERARLEVIAPAHVLGTIFLIIFGWLIKYVVHISAPAIMLLFIGFGISTSFNTSNTLIIDLHRSKPATATAAVNFVRCMISAGGVAAIVPMIEAMNPGWCFTFLGLLYVAIMPMLWAIAKWGPRWRAQVAEKRLQKEKEKEIAVAAAQGSRSNSSEVVPEDSATGKQDSEAKVA